MSQTKSKFAALMRAGLLHIFETNSRYSFTFSETELLNDKQAILHWEGRDYEITKIDSRWRRFRFMPDKRIVLYQEGVYKVFEDDKIKIFYEVKPRYDNFASDVCFLVKFQQLDFAPITDVEIAEILKAITLLIESGGMEVIKDPIFPEEEPNGKF